MLNHLTLLFDDFRHMFLKRRGPVSPFRLFVTHLRIKFKQKFFEIAHIKRQHERIFGFTVYFPHYPAFAHLWREIFVLENYYFESISDMPSVVDAGSNIGMSILYFKMLYPKARITGFEPDPATFGWLNKNILENHLQNVAVHNIALGNADGSTRFYSEANFEASGLNSTRPLPPGVSAEVTDVPLKKLSKMIDMNHPVDLLKIDVEGGEYGIFEDMEPHLANVREIFLEVHQQHGPLQEHMSHLFGTLERCGFRYAITSTFVTHHDFIANPDRDYACMVDAIRSEPTLPNQSNKS